MKDEILKKIKQRAKTLIEACNSGTMRDDEILSCLGGSLKCLEININKYEKLIES